MRDPEFGALPSRRPLLTRIMARLSISYFISGPAKMVRESHCHHRRAAFSAHLKSKVGLALAKAAALRVTLNLKGTPIISKSHTHPSHSQTSRLYM
jgi:hypothetical protein